MLLGREEVGVPEAVERLIGLQAQVPNPPYVGLWTRLRNFRRDDLTAALERREVVRAPLQRSTLHLMTAADYRLLRPALQPALTRALGSFFGKRARDLDVDRLVAAARRHLEERPRTFAELRELLSEVEPEGNPAAVAYVVRTYVPLVQVFPGGTWGSGGSLAYAPAESWLGGPLSGSEGPRDLVLRYLAAFGPATVKDAQAWSGLVRLKEPLEDFRRELRSYRDERGNELLDLPDNELPEDLADLPAPVRFVPEYDNLVLSHADRTRVISDEHRKRVFLSAGRVRSTILVDGFVRGAWRIEKTRQTTTLVIEPFETLSGGDRASLQEEGERLVRFVGEGAEEFEVRFE
jgi:hypothetical protein